MGFQKWKPLLKPMLGLTTVCFATTLTTILNSLMVSAQAQPTVLAPLTVRRHLHQLPGWQLTDDTLVCAYQFTNFVEAVTFVNELVPTAEALAHHPDIAITYNSVSFALTTHDAGGLTALDIQLAQAIQAIAMQPPFNLSRCTE
jgi:4a-hydroxytetrahydrobiopterin dehydratase